MQTPDTIRVTVTKWSLPSRRMRVVEILPGVYEEWTEDIVAAFDCKQQGDVSCLSLPYGTCTLKMDNLSRRFEPRSKSGLFQSIEERQGVETYIGVRLADGTVEYKRVGVFYQYSDGWKTGDNGLTMQWDLVDIIGLLADRAYLAPTVLPITLSGWIASLVSQLGTNFADRYTVDADYADLAVTASSRAAVSGKKCGDILRWACMATGTWPRADAETGKLAVEPLWNQGSKITLENLVNYPTMKANQSLASLIFHLSDGTEYVVSGNSTSSEKTVTIENPFLHTQAQALTAARLILSCYGGNQLELTGRGDPSSEIGDVDTVWLNESSATTARRIYQTFQFADGVLQGCQSKLLQADGSYLYTERAVFTESGSWTAPAGKTRLRVILVGHGGNGTDGEDGNFARAGKNGVDGLGGLVWADTIQINEQQTFAITIGEDAVFGPYSSANGKRYPNGYSDIQSGDSFARTGVAVPKSGTGDGGKGGKGGSQGRAHNEPLYDGDGNSDRLGGRHRCGTGQGHSGRERRGRLCGGVLGQGGERMSETYPILIPKILAAAFAPNPADINTKTRLTVTVTEETVYLEPTKYYSGEIIAGRSKLWRSKQSKRSSTARATPLRSTARRASTRPPSPRRAKHPTTSPAATTTCKSRRPTTRALSGRQMPRRLTD
ncbi:MAG: hypothetical protein ACLSHJ_06850 [Oscillospiraceae bacterium]